MKRRVMSDPNGSISVPEMCKILDGSETKVFYQDVLTPICCILD